MTEYKYEYWWVNFNHNKCDGSNERYPQRQKIKQV